MDHFRFQPNPVPKPPRNSFRATLFGSAVCRFFVPHVCVARLSHGQSPYDSKSKEQSGGFQ